MLDFVKRRVKGVLIEIIGELFLIELEGGRNNDYLISKCDSKILLLSIARSHKQLAIEIKT